MRNCSIEELPKLIQDLNNKPSERLEINGRLQLAIGKRWRRPFYSAEGTMIWEAGNNSKEIEYSVQLNGATLRFREANSSKTRILNIEEPQKARLVMPVYLHQIEYDSENLRYVSTLIMDKITRINF